MQKYVFAVNNTHEACEVGQIKCAQYNATSPICIDRTSVCDQKFDCQLQEDEANCDVDLSQYFNCSDETHWTPFYKRCDGKKYIIKVVYRT